jgi:hypothetical protein
MPNDHPKGSREQALSKKQDALFHKKIKHMIWSDLYGNVKLSIKISPLTFLILEWNLANFIEQ